MTKHRLNHHEFAWSLVCVGLVAFCLFLLVAYLMA